MCILDSYYTRPSNNIFVLLKYMLYHVCSNWLKEEKLCIWFLPYGGKEKMLRAGKAPTWTRQGCKRKNTKKLLNSTDLNTGGPMFRPRSDPCSLWNSMDKYSHLWRNRNPFLFSFGAWGAAWVLVALCFWWRAHAHMAEACSLAHGHGGRVIKMVATGQGSSGQDPTVPAFSSGFRAVRRSVTTKLDASFAHNKTHQFSSVLVVRNRGGARFCLNSGCGSSSIWWCRKAS
jgi:hypothetical protein